MKVLTKRQILLLHSALIRQSGGSDGIRDEGLLDSAVSTPVSYTHLTLPTKRTVLISVDAVLFKKKS